MKGDPVPGAAVPAQAKKFINCQKNAYLRFIKGLSI